MEENTLHRKLKSLSSLSSDIEDQSSECDSLESKRSPSDTEIPESSVSELEIQKTKTKQTKPVKNKAPKLPKFNKLIDVNITLDEHPVTEFEYLRDEPLEITTNKKEKKMSFFRKVKGRQQDKSSYSLAKSVLTNKDERDSLVVDAPVKIEGFISKAYTSNPREMFRDNLKTVINERKTLHIDTYNIFDKSCTDLTKKEEIIENTETSFHPSTHSNIKNLEKPTKIQETFKVNPPDLMGKSDSLAIPKEFTPVKTAGNNSRDKPIKVRLMVSATDQVVDKNLKSYPSTTASSPVHFSREQAESRELIEDEIVEGTGGSNDYSVSSKEKEEEEGGEGEGEGDRNLEGLISRKRIDEDREAIYSKYVKDMLEKEGKELFGVVNADFKRKNTEEVWENKKKMKIGADTVVKTQGSSKANVFSKADEDSDEEARFKFLKECMSIKNVRRNQENTLILDEKSNDFLKLIEKPEITRSHKTMLNTECAKSNSTVSTSESSGAHSYFKIKQKDIPQEISVQAPSRRRGNLISLLKK